MARNWPETSVGPARRVVMEEPTSLERWLWLVVFPAAGFLGFVKFLAPRLDYAGHFLAGFGATLGAAWLAARLTSGSPWAVVAATVACIGLGAVVEGTIFALAAFDDIDFGAQSLGAVLAGLALLHGRAGDPEADSPDLDSPLLGSTYGAAVACVSFASLVLGTLAAFA